MRTVTNDDAEAKTSSYTQAASTTTARALTTGSLRTEQMTRGRKRENIRLTTERDFPHLVELVLPPEGFRGVLLEIDVFHREHRIPVRRGLNRHEVKQVYIRFCFPDAATADAFRNRFGGECLTHAPGKPKPRTSATSSG
jgi:hypothetical protein